MTPLDHSPAGLPELSALFSADAGRLREPATPDWPAAVSLALRHGMGAAAFRRIDREKERWPVPAEHLDVLRNAFVAAVFASRKLQADAEAALTALADAGVEVLALKGLHLGSVYYEDAALRPMGDVDLLVRPGQSRTAWDALCALGYASRERGAAYWESRSAHHLPRLCRAGFVSIELHRTIARPGDAFRIDMDLLWRRSGRIHVGRNACSALSPEDLLLHLCLHAAHHRYRIPLRNVHDIALVARRHEGEMDWGRLASTATAFGTCRPVFCGLLLARELFGAKIPDALLDSLAPGADRATLLRNTTAAIMAVDTPLTPWLRLVAGEGGAPRKALRVLAHVLGIRYVLPDASRQVTVPGMVLEGSRRSLELLLRHARLLVQLALFRPTARAQLRTARTLASVEAWLFDPEQRRPRVAARGEGSQPRSGMPPG